MRTALAVVVVVGVTLLARRSEACSCWPEADPVRWFFTARAEAQQIFFGQVVFSDNAAERAVLQVGEVFKGALEVGERLSFRSFGGGDCSQLFEVGERWLIYDGGAVCSRTRRLEADDPELTWLRTGGGPERPLAVRRVARSCARCDIQTVAAALTGAAEPWGGQQPDAGLGWASPRFDRAEDGLVSLGVASGGRWFRLVERSAVYGEACRRVVSRTWCEAGATPACVDESPPVRVCDEDAQHLEVRGPLEALEVAQCNRWWSNGSAFCRLGSVSSLDGGAELPLSRVMTCVSEDDGSPEHFVCRVGSEVAPRAR